MSGERVFSPEQQAAIEAWTRRYPRPEMGLLGALRMVQRWRGRIGVP